MNDTIKLLKECNSGCKAAVDGMEQVLRYVSSPELKAQIESCSKRHTEIGDQCHTLLNSLGKNECDPPAIGMAFARAGTEMKLAINGDDSRIAEMMADGAGTGMKSIAKNLNACPSASQESRSLASEIIREEQNFFNGMLGFL